MKHILKCVKCANYTLNSQCSCGGVASTPRPAKFSPEDNYGRYRRLAKAAALKERGLL
ncbi:nucleolar RNA-binding Nop10p family protein [Candidatus Woesearchaeota archaeon]|nr:nucleolar RNA-binding Nop10p family protein [Candidatus Woesearchaeota archaeon]